MTTPDTPVKAMTEVDPEAAQKQALNKRLEAIAWGLFLIMIGGLSFIPDNRVPQGLWSIGVGIILLGLNAARYYNKIRLSGFTLVLGILALLTGIGDLLGLNLPTLAILLIILGLNLILKPWFEERGIF
jgi:hypothetical protein